MAFGFGGGGLTAAGAFTGAAAFAGAGGGAFAGAAAFTGAVAGGSGDVSGASGAAAARDGWAGTAGVPFPDVGGSDTEEDAEVSPVGTDPVGIAPDGSDGSSGLFALTRTSSAGHAFIPEPGPPRNR